METLDGRRFLTVNGVQTLGHAHSTVAGQIAELAGIGISAVRLSPQTEGFATVVQLYDDLVKQRSAQAAAVARLQTLLPGASFADGFLAGAPGLRRTL